MIHIKRISAILISVIIAAFSVLAGSAAVIYEQDGYKFTDLDANTVSLCGWDNRTPELILPNKIGDYYFAEISDFGLRGNNGITGLDISQPTNLRRIGLYAFADCTELSGEVVFPLRITDIGQSAFENCYQLESAIIYSNITTIKRQTFYNCSCLNNVQIPSSVQNIEALAFANCGSLRNITLPQSVTSISDSAFMNDRNIIINCYYGSYAQQYAIDNNINYLLIDGVKLGDVNGDGAVDVTDATFIQSYLAELETLEGIYLHAADTKNDGEVDISDATAIQMYAAEYQTGYPIGQVMLK